MENELLDVKQAARVLGVTDRRIRQLCQAGQIGVKIGSRWIIDRAKLEAFAQVPRPVGRPAQESEEGE